MLYICNNIGGFRQNYLELTVADAQNKASALVMDFVAVVSELFKKLNCLFLKSALCQGDSQRFHNQITSTLLIFNLSANSRASFSSDKMEN